MPRPTEAQREEALRVGWRVLAPLMLGMCLSLLALIPLIYMDWSDLTDWRAWFPVATFLGCFLTAETYLRSIVKRMK